MFGDVSKITLMDTVITVLVSLFVIFVIKKIYEKLIISMILKELTIANEKVDRINLIYLLLVGDNSGSRNKGGWNAPSRSGSDGTYITQPKNIGLHPIWLFPYERYIWPSERSISGVVLSILH